MTRTGAILKAVEAELEKHKSEIDSARDLEGVKIVLRFRPEHLRPRLVVVRTDPARQQ